MKKIIWIILIMTLCLVSCGIANEPEAEEEVAYYNDRYLKFNLRRIPNELNPNDWNDESEKIILNNVYEGLVKETASGVELAMAKSYTISGDYKNYTFKLRDSRWSDGTEVTSWDFKDSILSRMDEKAYNLISLVGIEEINTVDDKTIEFRLKRPNTNFINYLAEPIFMPQKKQGEEAVYNGPFHIVYYDNDMIRMFKNEEHWNHDQVYLQIVEGHQMYFDEAIKAYRNKRLDLVLDIPMMEVEKLIVEEDNLSVFPQSSVFCFLFNEAAFQEDELVIEDENLQEHLFQAVDRKAIVENFGSVTMKPEIVAVPKHILEGTDESEFWAFIDEYEAKSSSSFVSNNVYQSTDKVIELSIRGNAKDEYEISRLIRDMWKINLGVNTTVLVLDDKKYLDALEKGEFQVIAFQLTGEAVDPLSYLNVYHSDSKFNFGGYSDPVYDSNIEAAFSSGERIRNIYIKKSLVQLTESNHVLAISGFDAALILGNEFTGAYKGVTGKIYFDNIDTNRKE